MNKNKNSDDDLKCQQEFKLSTFCYIYVMFYFISISSYLTTDEGRQLVPNTETSLVINEI